MKYTTREINEVKEKMVDIIKSNPDLYPEFVSVCGYAWSEFKKEYTEKEVALDTVIRMVIPKTRARTLLANTGKGGNLNLDLFPAFKESLEKRVS